MRRILWPLAWLYAFITKARNFFYTERFFDIESVDTPILSVGNITAGGTGKTPIIAELIEWCTEQEIKVGVISRGYKGSFQGVVKVEPKQTGKGANYYGDEPFMLARRYPQVPIYLAAKRIEAARRLEKNEAVDLIIADDAFQHRKMGRTYDVVVIDMTEPMENYLPLPVGRAREPMESTRRSHFIILNKVNLGRASDLIIVLKALNRCWKGMGESEKPRLIESTYSLKKIVKPDSPEVLWMKSSDPVLLVSGIGNPQSFEKMMNDEGITYTQHLILPDHYKYDEATVSVIQEKMKSSGATQIVTTEKDYVKLKEFAELAEPLWVAQLGVRFSESVKEMYEVLGRDLR